MKGIGLFSMNKFKKVAILLAVTTFLIAGMKSSFATTGKVTVTTVRVRAAANTESEILERASNGEEIEVLGLEGDWYKVKFKEKEGYIHKDYLRVEEEIAKPAEEVVEETVAEAAGNIEDVKENTDEEQNKIEEKTMELGDTVNKETNAYLLPTFMSTKVVKLEQGRQVKIATTMANWAKIEVEGKEAWLPKTFLMREINGNTETPNEQETTTEEQQPVAEAEAPAPVQTETPLNKAAYISSSAAANLRSGPSTDTQSIGKLARHTKITVVAENGDWYKVSYNGKVGYVYKQLVKDGEPPAETSSRSQEESRTATTQTQQNNVAATAPAEASAPVAQAAPAASSGNVVQVAQQYVGSRYVYGGSSPSGFDCSGFTSYVYKQCGVSLSRTSYAQANQGTAVDKSNLQAGDLLLFTTNGSNGGISHVGIYVGNGQFIHAANPNRGVVYDSINSGYYATNYAGARRVQ